MSIPNFGKLNLLSFAFLLIFFAYNSAALLAPQILLNMGYDGLGFYTVSFIYLVFGISSLFSAVLVKKLSSRVAFVMSSMTYAFWIFCFLAPAYSI